MPLKAAHTAAVPLTAVQTALRETFDREVSARLPRLQALLAGDLSILEDARRDAHSLASSAVIVDEPDIGRLAQEVELDPIGGPLAELVSALALLGEAG